VRASAAEDHLGGSTSTPSYPPITAYVRSLPSSTRSVRGRNADVRARGEIAGTSATTPGAGLRHPDDAGSDREIVRFVERHAAYRWRCRRLAVATPPQRLRSFPGHPKESLVAVRFSERQLVVFHWRARNDGTGLSEATRRCVGDWAVSERRERGPQPKPARRRTRRKQ